ncbi:hypothetical protein ACU6QD_04965 [Corynebacterium glucuronolyticum]
MRLIRAIVTFLVNMALVFGLFMLVKWVTGSAMPPSYWDVAAIGVVVIVLEAAVSRTLSFRSFYRLGEQDR